MKIGIEAHIQLNCKSKIFCSCPTKVSKEPNTNTCEICTGQPGSKPVLNQEAINKAIKVALALNCKINKENFFSRKSYFYPDLAKNYQISQYELPLAEKGNFHNIRITRIHLEEDPGALIHKDSYCLIDYNRSGIPLIEIVTEPDLKSPKEAREFIKELIIVLDYLDVYDKKSETTLKADLNISTTGEKVEIKNVNGLQDIEQALNYEIKRQKTEKVKKQETRGWNPERKITILQRTKEKESDYGYITECDLPILKISKELIDNIQKTIPELSKDKTSRFLKDYKLEKFDAEILSKNKELANLFEEVIKEVSPQLTAKLLVRDLIKRANKEKKTIKELIKKVNSKQLISLLKLFEENKINDKIFNQTLREMTEGKLKSKDIEAYLKDNKLLMQSDTSQLEKLCSQAIKENPQAVEEYKNGNEKSLNFLMGKVMQLSNKTANPQEILKILKKFIN